MESPKSKTRYQCKVCGKIISAKLPHTRKNGKDYCENRTEFVEVE